MAHCAAVSLGQGVARRVAAQPARQQRRVSRPAVSTDAEFEALMQRDAFAELVKMAVEKDPSLAQRAAHSLEASTHQQQQQLPNQTKPGWLRQRAPQGERFEYLHGQMQDLKLATVCQEAQCPNLGECWNGGSHGIGTATIMLMGDTCTRGCRFCAVSGREGGQPERKSGAGWEGSTAGSILAGMARNLRTRSMRAAQSAFQTDLDSLS